MKIDDTKKATTKQVAEIVGVVDRTIREYENRGIIKKVSPGRYDLEETVQAIIKFKEQAEENVRNRLYAAQAEKHELEAAEKRKEVGKTSDFLSALMDIFSIVSTQLDGLGGRLSNELAGIKEPGLIRNRLLDESRNIRKDCADKIKQLAEHWRCSNGSLTATRTAAKKKPERMGKAKSNTTKRKRGTRTV